MGSPSSEPIVVHTNNRLRSDLQSILSWKTSWFKMTKKEGHFDYMEDVMKSYCQWYDQPDTVMGKLIKAYNVLRILVVHVLLSFALSQVYFYGMSYVVHDSAVFLPLGVMGSVVNSNVAWNFRHILKTANQFEFYLNSFVDDWEIEIIERRIHESKRLVIHIVRVIKFYIYITVVSHTTSVTLHSLFGLFPKPILLPLVFETFLEGNYEIRPQLILIMITSAVYVHLVSSLVALITLTVHFFGISTGTLQVLIKRLENISSKADRGCEKLKVDSDLSDTIQKHADLLNILNSMMGWAGFPVSFLLFSCSILFCINAITLKQSLGSGEYSAFCVWGTFLLVSMALAFIICSRGQDIEIKSEELLRAIYNLPWHRESSKSRRKVSMMMTEGTRLISLNFKGLMGINLLTFSEMLKTSYSYFMLLNSSA